MAELRFAWDVRKDRANQREHGVSFDEARSVFWDENAKLYSDPDHSRDEDRFILLGTSALLRVLVVCHCSREGGDVIRIISARRATARERRSYGS
ncbi:MAG TPA: BrnT family toxin [Polyangia bacterium]|jgi:hypothetical protein